MATDENCELVYADDAFIVAEDSDSAAKYMAAIAEAGANFGLKHNWRTLEAPPFAASPTSPSRTGSWPLETTESFIWARGPLMSSLRGDSKQREPSLSSL
jgi:hypothetical protein